MVWDWSEGRRQSGQDVPLVVGDVVPAQEIDKFVGERARGVMLALRGDVVTHALDAGLADGERGVSGLPGEFGDREFLVHEPRGIGLEVAHQVGEGDDGMNGDEEVDVVGHSADGEQIALPVARDTAEVWVETGRGRVGDEWLAQLG